MTPQLIDQSTSRLFCRTLHRRQIHFCHPTSSSEAHELYPTLGRPTNSLPLGRPTRVLGRRW